MNPVDSLRDWLKETPALSTFKEQLGPWSDTSANLTDSLFSITQQGGRRGMPETRFPQIRLVLLGPQKGRSAAHALGDTANAIADRLQNDYQACGIAQISLLGDIIGPGYTAEDRPWYELNLELII